MVPTSIKFVGLLYNFCRISVVIDHLYNLHLSIWTFFLILVCREWQKTFDPIIFTTRYGPMYLLTILLVDLVILMKIKFLLHESLNLRLKYRLSLRLLICDSLDGLKLLKTALHDTWVRSNRSTFNNTPWRHLESLDWKT